MAGSPQATQPLDKVVMHKGFDRPEVGARADEGHPAAQRRKPSTKAVGPLRVELFLAAIAQIQTDQTLASGTHGRLTPGPNPPDEANHTAGRTLDTLEFNL